MDIQNFSGKTHHDIGRQQGEIYARKGMGLWLPVLSRETYDSQMGVYGDFCSGVLEECDGVAEGCGVPAESVRNTMVCGELLLNRPDAVEPMACTVVGVKNMYGTVVGRNLDWPEISKKGLAVFSVSGVEDAIPFLTVTDRGVGLTSMITGDSSCRLYIPEDAINGKGLFVCLTSCYAPGSATGLSRVHMVQRISESCGTVKEALKLFKDVPVCRPANFFLADAGGDMAVVEHLSDKNYRILEPENGMIIKANHLLHPDFAGKDTLPAGHTSRERFEYVQKELALRGRVLDPTGMLDMLTDRESPVCQGGADTHTIWSLGLGMEGREYRMRWDLFGEPKEMELAA